MNHVHLTNEFIENRTYDEIAVGDSATLVRTLRPEDIQMFAIMSGDINPATWIPSTRIRRCFTR